MSTHDQGSERTVLPRAHPGEVEPMRNSDHLEHHRTQVAERRRLRKVRVLGLRQLDLQHVIERRQRHAGLGYPDMRVTAVWHQQLAV
jgi:hypothetical protein